LKTKIAKQIESLTNETKGRANLRALTTLLALAITTLVTTMSTTAHAANFQCTDEAQEYRLLLDVKGSKVKFDVWRSEAQGAYTLTDNQVFLLEAKKTKKNLKQTSYRGISKDLHAVELRFQKSELSQKQNLKAHLMISDSTHRSRMQSQRLNCQRTSPATKITSSANLR
jgi:hypothetical protein